MDGKLTVALNKIRRFCATQLMNFIAGMAIAVLMMLNLGTIMPVGVGAPLCPFLTAAIYLLLRAIPEPFGTWKGNPNIKESALASFLGGLYAVILSLI